MKPYSKEVEEIREIFGLPKIIVPNSIEDWAQRQNAKKNADKTKPLDKQITNKTDLIDL